MRRLAANYDDDHFNPHVQQINQKMDPEVISAVASLYFDRDDAKLTKGINLQVFFENLQKRDPFIGT